MNARIRFLVYVIAGLAALALIEQLTPIHLYASRLDSTTHTEDTIKARTGDLISTVRVERPLLRWLPLLKYGETVYFHTYRHADGARTFLARDATTRTTLLVIGLCSTEKYDQLANEPFEKIRLDSLK